jgi:hypothetical protein
VTSPPSSAAELAWRRQSVWSQTATRLKAAPARARLTALALTIAGAVLALAGAQLKAVHGGAGRVLAFAGAAALGVVAVLRGLVGQDEISDWVQARSVSEALKAEVYRYLTCTGPYAGPDRDARLDAEVDRLEQQADSLQHYTLDVQPTRRGLPAVCDVDSYIEQRLSPQIETYYRPNAEKMRSRVRWVRWVEITLAVLAAVLAAAAGAFAVSNIGAWVAVVTTAAAAVTAHAAAERYEFLLIEYSRTAHELTRLRAHDGAPGSGTPLTDEEFVRRCEDVISAQNDKWMAKWGAGSLR